MSVISVLSSKKGMTTIFSSPSSSPATALIFDLKSMRLLAYTYPSTVTITFGLTCPKRSNTPCAPKSGEQDVQVAPIAAAPAIIAIASGMFGRNPATRSPG